MLTNTSNATDTQDKLAYSVKEFADMTSLSPEYLYLEIRRKKLKAKVFGQRRLILAEDARSYLNDALNYEDVKK